MDWAIVANQSIASQLEADVPQISGKIPNAKSWFAEPIIPIKKNSFCRRKTSGKLESGDEMNIIKNQSVIISEYRPLIPHSSPKTNANNGSPNK